MEKEKSFFKLHPKASIVALFTILLLLFVMFDVILSEPIFCKGVAESKNQYERSFEVNDYENIVKTIKSESAMTDVEHHEVTTNCMDNDYYYRRTIITGDLFINMVLFM